MSLVSSILPALDAVRAIPGVLGLCSMGVTRRVRTWSGTSLASGTATNTDTAITLPGGVNPKVRRVAYKETVQGGGRYQEGDYRIGPLTPTYSGGGQSVTSLTPAITSSPTEVYWKLGTGADNADGVVWCSEVQIEADHPMHMYVVVRPLGVVP